MAFFLSGALYNGYLEHFPERTRYDRLYDCSTLRLLSMHANNFWKESMNFCTPSSCSCRVTWS